MKRSQREIKKVKKLQKFLEADFTKELAENKENLAKSNQELATSREKVAKEKKQHRQTR